MPTFLPKYTTAVAGALLALATTTGATLADFQDNSIGYRYSTMFKEPAVAKGGDIEKSILNFTHVDQYKYGSNFFAVDFLISSGNDPTPKGDEGANEFYAVYRHDLSFNKVTGTTLASVPGFIRDVALHAGGDFNTKNTSFGSQKRLLVLGPQIQFDVPMGFFNVAFDYAQEWNRNGIVGKQVGFDPTFEIEAVWGFNIPAGFTTVSFQGFFNYISPKGTDGFGAKTVYEILTRPEILVDAGEPFGKKGVVQLGFGYEYWLNKFGNDNAKVPGSLANTPMFIGKVHF